MSESVQPRDPAPPGTAGDLGPAGEADGGLPTGPAGTPAHGSTELSRHDGDESRGHPSDSASAEPRTGDGGEETDGSGADEFVDAFGTDELTSEHLRFDCTGTDQAGWAEGAEAARAAVEEGECIVLPTDTVYGIGADAFSGDAVQRLLDAKMRGRDMPPPVLIGEPSLVRALATDVPEAAKELIARHWPGPLTVILRIQPSLRMDLGDNEGTIALRVPDHELAREVLRRTGPMAVSSANISGKPAALSCEEAVDQLGDRVSVYLDGGTLTATGGSSTIVDFTQHEQGEVLRRGALGLDVLRETLPDLVDRTAPDPGPGQESADTVEDAAADTGTPAAGADVLDPARHGATAVGAAEAGDHDPDHPPLPGR